MADVIEAPTRQALPEAAAPRAADYAIRAENLRKRYGDGTTHTDALLGVDLHVHQGEIIGVLGPNGAGKTTLIEILEGLRVADAGRALVLGQDATDATAMKSIRHRMGISVQNTVLPPLLTVQELLALHCGLFPNSRPADTLIEQLGLVEKRKEQIRRLSGGQQQRVAVALAVVGDPELLFLDEPTSQLDPQARRAVWELLEQQRRRRNAAILITTHQMEEAQRICDRVLILDRGAILAEGTPTALVAAHCPGQVVEFVAPARADLHFLDGSAAAQPESTDRVRVRVNTRAPGEVIAELMARQGRGELAVEDIRVDRQSLEDVFLKLTGRGMRD
jgi:ABC-2 type transport system ATP-binding protein